MWTQQNHKAPLGLGCCGNLFFFLPLDFTAESYRPLLSQVNEGQLMLENRVQYGEHERKVGVCIAVSWARGEMFTNSSEATFGPLLKTRGLQIWNILAGFWNFPENIPLPLGRVPFPLCWCIAPFFWSPTNKYFSCFWWWWLNFNYGFFSEPLFLASFKPTSACAPLPLLLLRSNRLREQETVIYLTPSLLKAHPRAL